MKPHVYVCTAAAGIVVIAIGSLAHVSGFDIALARHILSFYDGAFPRNHWFLKSVMHEGARSVITAALASFTLLAIILRLRGKQTAPFYNFYIFVATALLFVGAIALLKAMTTFVCPWSLDQLGGNRVMTDYRNLFSLSTYGKGRCFPAGHSSGGYAWIGLAFALATTPAALWRGIALLLPIGIALSVTQILRGAHFLSHELTTLGLALLAFSTMGFFIHHQTKSAG